MRTSIVVLLGGLSGFVVGAGVYLAVNPVLEERTGLLREMQGMLWNLVPLLTFVGLVVGWWFARRRPS